VYYGLYKTLVDDLTHIRSRHVHFKVTVFVTGNPTPVLGQQQQMHSMSRVPQQPGQGGSMNLTSMVGPGPGQQPGPGQPAQPPPQSNQSGTPSGQQPQTIGPQQTVAAPQQGTPPGGPGQPSAQQVSQCEEQT
jgi:hypothetical protein